MSDQKMPDDFDPDEVDDPVEDDEEAAADAEIEAEGADGLDQDS